VDLSRELLLENYLEKRWNSFPIGYWIFVAGFRSVGSIPLKRGGGRERGQGVSDISTVFGDLLKQYNQLRQQAALDFLIERFGHFVLVFFRVAGMMTIMPIFGSVFLPQRFKAGLSLVLAIVIWTSAQVVPFGTPEPPPLPDQPQKPSRVWLVKLPAARALSSVGDFISAALGEAAIGILLGLGASMIFSGMQLCGQILGFQMGISLANVIDPVNNTQVSLLSSFYFYFGTFVFLMMDGHLILVDAIRDAFRVIPLAGFTGEAVNGNLVGICWNMLSYSFVLGIRLAAPAMLTLFITEVGMGFINRTVPQIHLLTAGAPVRMLLGFIVMAISLPLAASYMGEVFTFLGFQLRAFNDAMAPVIATTPITAA